MHYTLTINKNNDVFQHEFVSSLDEKSFLSLMAEEWMIDEDNGDALTIEVKEPVG